MLNLTIIGKEVYLVPPALQSQPKTITLERYEALPENKRIEVFENQPDLMIVCDKEKLDGKRCNGAPDFIIEIVSPSNPADDYIRKLYYYKNAEVREYWIVDPRRKTVTVNYFSKNMLNIQYSFDATIKVNIYEDLLINFSDISDLLNI